MKKIIFSIFCISLCVSCSVKNSPENINSEPQKEKSSQIKNKKQEHIESSVDTKKLEPQDGEDAFQEQNQKINNAKSIEEFQDELDDLLINAEKKHAK